MKSCVPQARVFGSKQGAPRSSTARPHMGGIVALGGAVRGWQWAGRLSTAADPCIRERLQPAVWRAALGDEELRAPGARVRVEARGAEVEHDEAAHGRDSRACRSLEQWAGGRVAGTALGNVGAVD